MTVTPSAGWREVYRWHHVDPESQTDVCRGAMCSDLDGKDMEQITIRLPEEMIESLDDEAAEHGESRSEYVRNVLASRTEHDELQTEVERLRREKRQILDHQETKRELATYVEEEQEWRSAPIWTRAKWWVVGRPTA